MRRPADGEAGTRGTVHTYACFTCTMLPLRIRAACPAPRPTDCHRVLPMNSIMISMLATECLLLMAGARIHTNVTCVCARRFGICKIIRPACCRLQLHGRIDSLRTVTSRAVSPPVSPAFLTSRVVVHMKCRSSVPICRIRGFGSNCRRPRRSLGLSLEISPIGGGTGELTSRSIADDSL